jgi:hypothetical protein
MVRQAHHDPPFIKMKSELKRMLYTTVILLLKVKYETRSHGELDEPLIQYKSKKNFLSVAVEFNFVS